MADLSMHERRWLLANLFTSMVIGTYDEWDESDRAEVMDLVEDHFILYGIPGHPGGPKEIALPFRKSQSVE